jgi:hypothetical protein
MSSLAGQFARKVALFVKDEKVNASEFQLKSTEGDKIVMTDGDDLEVLWYLFKFVNLLVYRHCC